MSELVSNPVSLRIVCIVVTFCISLDRHDLSTAHTDPAVKAIMEACVTENDADRHASNLKGTWLFCFYHQNPIRLRSFQGKIH